jgi:hypothetical protein
MGVADEQAAAGILLQPADVLTDGGLLQVEAAGSFGEAAGLHDAEEALQVGWVEHCLSDFTITISLFSVVHNGRRQAHLPDTTRKDQHDHAEDGIFPPAD